MSAAVVLLLLSACGNGSETNGSLQAHEAASETGAAPAGVGYGDAVHGQDSDEQLLAEIRRLRTECDGREEDRDCFFLARAELTAMERGLIKQQARPTGGEESDPEDLLSSEFRRCTAGLARVETLQCVEQELDSQDALLNSNYQDLLKELSSDRRRALRIEQRKWIKDRDQRCEAESEQGVGPVGLNLLECHMIETARRRWQLLDASFEAKSGG